MPMTEDHFARVCAMRDQVIDDQKWEIARFKTEGEQAGAENGFEENKKPQLRGL